MKCCAAAFFLISSRISCASPAGAAPVCTLTSYHAKRSAASPQVADLRPALHRRGCWSLPPDRDTLLHLSTPHLVSHTDAPDTRSPLRVPTRAGGPNQKHAPLQRTARPSDNYPLTRDQPQCGRAADCPAHWIATIKSRRRRASQLLLPLQRRPHGSLKKAAISR